MGWKDWSYTKKGLIIGLIITFILILIPSWSAPKHNYNQEVIWYEGYNIVIENCGNNPTNDCLKYLCVDSNTGFCGLMNVKVEPQCGIGFCEGVNRKVNNQCEKESLPEEFCDWHTYVRNKKPNIFLLLIPNIKDGLEVFLMFGIFGVLALILPPIIGAFIGLIIGKAKSNSESVHSK